MSKKHHEIHEDCSSNRRFWCRFLDTVFDRFRFTFSQKEALKGTWTSLFHFQASTDTNIPPPKSPTRKSHNYHIITIFDTYRYHGFSLTIPGEILDKSLNKSLLRRLWGHWGKAWGSLARSPWRGDRELSTGAMGSKSLDPAATVSCPQEPLAAAWLRWHAMA